MAMLHMVKMHPASCSRSERRQWKDKRSEPTKCKKCGEKKSRKYMPAHERICTGPKQGV